MPIVSEFHTVYTVRPGDTLYSIAVRLGSTVSAIESANALYPPFTDPGLIFPGQVLLVPELRMEPGGGRVIHRVAAGETLYGIARRYAAHPDLVQGLNPGIANPNVLWIDQSLLVPAYVYEVAPGDTLFGIAERAGLVLTAVLNANQGRAGFSPDVIYPGYRLLLPLPSTRNIAVRRPLPGTLVRAGDPLAGWARAFEASILYRIVDANGREITRERPIMTSAGAPAYGTFSEPIVFDVAPTAAIGEIWVYTRSARDGSIQDLTRLPIRFS